MLSRMLECDVCTSGSNAWLALRKRVSMSEIGSVIINLPARFRYARDQAVQRRFAEGQTRTGEFAQISAAPTAHRATVHQPGRARVLRPLRQPGGIFLGLQLSAQCRV